MGLLHSMRTKLSPTEEKLSHFAHKYEGKIHHGLDKAAHAVDRKTKGKYRYKIESASGKAKHAMDRLAHKEDRGGTPPSPPTGGATPPPPPTS
ncbi:antitoxin [Streptomyces torulosus]|uniref:antitoxin n=1 Tax=Streptomyces torulosus TaxID=68276 RepID=UPI0006EB7F54|nr:antitoxin [Streptomyces torulosus]